MAQSNGLKKVLVTGGSGMIGRAVLSNLLATRKCLIRTQVRDRLEARKAISQSVDLTLVEMEAADFTRVGDQEMRALTKDCDFVVHAAGLVHKESATYQEYEVVNVRATHQLAEACIANKVHTLVFLSTSAVYGKGPFSNIPEEGPLAAKTPYAVSKSTSEQYLASLAGKIPRVVILRPSLVFGEGDRGNMLSLIKQIKEEKYVHVGGGQTPKSLICSNDLAQAIRLCIERLPEGHHVFNIANPKAESMRDLVDSIAAGLNVSKKFPSVPEGMLKLGLKAAAALMPGKVAVTPEQVEKLATETTCSVDKFVSATGFAPATEVRIALKQEIDWATNNNLL
ncbi:MAG: NAD-dependent epimerase/dehydratase family protein [Cyanobacteria bacterium SZAS TMP-1]|nr:NAD-dependent epimerase/dehydratase family protein [Cyanobacteria bacterium SZAS TMP-1]